MPNNIAVSITADVADLQVKRAILSAELKQAQKDLNDFAKTAKDAGVSDQLKTSMLSAGDAVARTRNQIRSLDSEMKSLTVSTAAEATATKAATHGHMSSRASFEALVLVHETLQGRFSRTAGSLMIMAQAMAGGEASAAALSAVMSPLGVAVIAVGAATVGAAVSTLQLEQRQQTLAATLVGTAAASGLSATAIQTAGDAASKASGQAGTASLESAEAFASAGVRSQAVITDLTASVQTFAKLTGEKAPDAQKELAEAMRDPVKGAEDLNAKLGILDSTTLEHIKNLVAMGDKEGAVEVLTQSLQTRMTEARQAGIGMAGGLDFAIGRLRDMWDWLGKVNQQIELFNSFGFAAGSVQQRGRAQADAVTGAIQRDAQRNLASQGGADVFASTPEGQDEAHRQALANSLARAQLALKADTELRGENSEAARRDAQAISEYKRAIDTYLPSGEKAHRLAVLDTEIAAARHQHNAALVADLTKQKALVGVAGEVMSAQEAAQRAADSGALGGAHTGAGAKGPDVVQQWTQQLHEQEMASGEFFKDQTAAELAFWKSKLSQTRAGSKEWLEVQARVYEANKSLAHQAYDEQLSLLNDKLEADRDSWSKEEADWRQKLDFIRGKFGEESREYHDAHRQFEAAERDHVRAMAEIDRQAAQARLTSLRATLDTDRSIREANARTSEAAIAQSGNYSPLGQVRAAAQIAALHQQTMRQEIADLEIFHARENSELEKAVADAEAAYGRESQQYTKAIEDKKRADEDFHNRHRQLDNQMVNETRTSLLRIQQAWHSYIDPQVQIVGNEIKGLITGTEGWGQALSNIAVNEIGLIVDAVERMVANWIVGLITGQATQKATAVSSVMSYAGIAGAAGVASMAGAPFPIDLSAPAFGASMAAAAAAFAPLASLDVGTNEVPSDMVAQIHAGERIIPAADNRELMSAVRGGGQGGARTVNNHFSPVIHAHHPPRLADMLDEQGGDFLSWLERAHRDGRLRWAA
jgi:phage-related minor tail protein